MTALSRMIQQQVEALGALTELDVSRAVKTIRGGRRIILIGTGTSQHAAELGAQMLESAGLDARWEPASQWARWSSATASRDGDVLLVITHTAETAYALRARAAALAATTPVISITGQGRGWPEALETVPAEESETYTVSYTSALVVLARLAYELGAPLGSSEDLSRTVEAVRAVCTEPEISGVPVPARSLAIIGPGPWGVTAREGALKIREGARILAEGFDSDRFLHGAAVPYTAADGLIVLEPAADPDGLTGALATAAAGEGMQVATLSSSGTALPPLLAQIPMTVRLQLLADRYARLRSHNPDVAIVGKWSEHSLWRLGAP